MDIWNFLDSKKFSVTLTKESTFMWHVEEVHLYHLPY